MLYIGPCLSWMSDNSYLINLQPFCFSSEIGDKMGKNKTFVFILQNNNNNNNSTLTENNGWQWQTIIREVLRLLRTVPESWGLSVRKCDRWYWDSMFILLCYHRCWSCKRTPAPKQESGIFEQPLMRFSDHILGVTIVWLGNVYYHWEP